MEGRLTNKLDGMNIKAWKEAHFLTLCLTHPAVNFMFELNWVMAGVFMFHLLHFKLFDTYFWIFTFAFLFVTTFKNTRLIIPRN